MAAKLKKCRLCKSKKFTNLFSLGNLSFTGKFPKSIKSNIPKDNLDLVMCKKCKLIQLDRSFSPNYLYSNDYGYRTGINKTMTKHVQFVVREAIKLVAPSKNDFVLDIASNDATLLNFYNKKLKTVGVDPLIQKHKKFYNKIDYKLSDFFSYNLLKKNDLNKKYKIITALSVFYDLNNPRSFVKDISKVLHEDGVFILEHADLLSIIKNCLFDTICHEHLEYYSSKVIDNLCRGNNLRIFDININDINGGSKQYLICHQKSSYKTNKNKIYKILNSEKKLKLSNEKTFKNFINIINNSKLKLNNFLKKANNLGKTIHGYGASTKGNVLLQYYKIDNKMIKYVAERNKSKYGLYTPSTKIKIISEALSRFYKPDYYLVLPWHFKKEILHREKEIRKRGTKFIFPLPKLRII